MQAVGLPHRLRRAQWHPAIQHFVSIRDRRRHTHPASPPHSRPQQQLAFRFQSAASLEPRGVSSAPYVHSPRSRCRSEALQRRAGPVHTYEAILVLSRLHNIDTRTSDHLTCSPIPIRDLLNHHAPKNPPVGAKPPTASQPPAVKPPRHAPRTVHVHRENHAVYFQPERATTQKQEHRQDTEDRANNAYTEKREGRQRGGGRSGFLCWRPRVRGLPNRGIGSVSHPRGLRARRA